MSDRLSNLHRQGARQTLIGLVPAAGKGARLQPLPFSKELYPIGFHCPGNSGNPHPKPVCVSLLEKMRFAGATEVFIVLRDGKWDIPSYLSDGGMLNMHLAYLMMRFPFGVPFTIDQAFPFVRHATIVFGFPDILFHPDDAFLELIARLDKSRADVVLGLFPVSTPGRMDEVELTGGKKVTRIHVKPAEAVSSHTWIIAAWAPSFTSFLHEFVSEALKKEAAAMENREVSLSEVMNAAIKNGLRVDNVIFQDGTCLDIGIPENLIKAVQPVPGASWDRPDIPTKRRSE